VGDNSDEPVGESAEGGTGFSWGWVGRAVAAIKPCGRYRVAAFAARDNSQ